jgi:predicted negative regulator of RcsB-dependent stress response
MLKNSFIHSNLMLFFMFTVLGMTMLFGYNAFQYFIQGGY